MICRSSMTPAEKKAVEAVVRAAKRWNTQLNTFHYPLSYEIPLDRAVARLLREEAKREKRRGK